MFDELREFIKNRMAEKVETRVGKVDPSLIKELTANRKAHDAAHDEIEMKIKQFVQAVREEHEPECDRFNREKADIWEKIFDELGLNQAERGRDYKVDEVTGVVSVVGVAVEDDQPIGPLQ